MDTADNRKLLTKPQLAERYGVVTRTIDNMMARKELPYLKLGKKLVRFDPAETDEFIERRFKVKAD
jgi:excisionase family DNA binding protein